MPRFYCPVPLTSGALLELPPSAARHVQVLRLQPGDALTLFDGGGGEGEGRIGGEFDAVVQHMGRSSVSVLIGPHHALEREAVRPVHLLAGITAGERMEWLIEKATELGAASITPIACERSVLKLKGERADKKHAHWHAIAIAACEQCARNRPPHIAPAQSLAQALALPHWPPAGAQRLVLSLRRESQALRQVVASCAAEVAPLCLLSGPEGGLTGAEEALALAHGFTPVTLGARVLRAETAPLAALAALLI